MDLGAALSLGTGGSVSFFRMQNRGQGTSTGLLPLHPQTLPPSVASVIRWDRSCPSVSLPTLPSAPGYGTPPGPGRL